MPQREAEGAAAQPQRLSRRAEWPEEQLGVVIETDASILLMRVENLSQGAEHRGICRLPGSRNVRRGKQASPDAVEVEDLLLWEYPRLPTAAEERIQRRGVHVPMIDPPVIGAVFAQELLVRAEKRRSIRTSRVPEQRDHACRSQDARELETRFLAIEPMKRLTGRDRVDARVLQRRRFGSRSNAVKLRL